MKLARVTFLGIRGLRDATYDLTNAGTGRPHDLVLVTGGSGSGKTRFLEAIVLAKEIAAPYGVLPSPEGWLEGDGEAAKIVLTWWLDEEERAASGSAEALVTTESLLFEDSIRADIDDGVQAVLERYEQDATRGKLEYFPWDRRLVGYGNSVGLDEMEQRLLRASNDPRKYSFLPRFFVALRRETAMAEYFGTLLSYLSHTVRYAPPGPDHEAWECLSSRGGPPVAAYQLSSFEADAVVFAATATLTRLSHSLVLVDRPDLHAEPARVQPFVAALGSSLGVDNQVIVTSQSRELLAALDPAQIIRLDAGG
jgi:hypothetical protein